jgi:ABC-type multidrug transport system ATPase subunit
VQEICDRVGIFAEGRLMREGSVAELVAIENQVELILESPSLETLQQIRALLAKTGTRLIAERQPQTSLEKLFLEATKSPPS